MLNVGKINKLKVLRKSDLGYMLTDGESEVLLHFKESNTDTDYEDGTMLDVFLYYDKKKRISATCNHPFVTISKPGFVHVKEVIQGTGVFVDINTPKDILISKDYLPYDTKMWPQIGDTLLVILKEKKDTLTAKPLNQYEIKDYANDKVYEVGEYKEGFVYRILDAGISVVTEDFKHIFIYKKMLRGSYRIGEEITLKIINKKDDNDYNGSLIKNKEEMIDPDKELILNYLKHHNNVLDADSKSQSEDIERLLNLSRKAFKRALGALYKEDLVYFKDGKTYLNKE